MADRRLIARDQNKGFVESARRRVESASLVEDRLGLRPGRGNAYIEFDAEPDEMGKQPNSAMQSDELFFIGDVDLTDRNATAFDNF